MSKELMQGNIAMAEAAARAGCRFFAGYPITPQNEVPEYLSVRLPELGGHFIQGESEIASIMMVMGTSVIGIRSLTSSSGPGFSLKSEGISFLAAMRLPVVLLDVMRGGPAVGPIYASQSDYSSATKSPAPGGTHTFVIAPSTVQEAADIIYEAFDIADKYRLPVTVLADAMIGNMMESITLPEMRELGDLPTKDDWILTKRSADGRERKMSTVKTPVDGLADAIELQKLYKVWEEEEARWEEYMLDDAEYVICAFGSTARIARTSVQSLRAKGIKIGMLRPITLFPFPKKAFKKLDPTVIKKLFVAEMAIPSQMGDDVLLATSCKIPTEFIATACGVIISSELIENSVLKLL